MRTLKLEAVEKQGSMNRDQYTQLPVIRLVKDEEKEHKTLAVKKYIFLADIISYEHGTETGEFDWEGDTTYIVTPYEMYYISGNVDDFHKEMVKFISSVRKLNSSEGA